MFEVTEAHVLRLDDAQLRELVALLCEAELRRIGLPTSAVTAGGDQRAPDGGIDVRVELQDGEARLNGYVKRIATGFQVKCEDIPQGKVRKEMTLEDGSVKPALQELASLGGAYIIVCSQGSVADKPLRDRRAAMREVIDSVPGGPNVLVDFYDRKRIASWVRDNPSLIPWVLKAVGQPQTGWFPFGAWPGMQQVNAAGPPPKSYVLDDQCRLHDGSATSESSIPIAAGMARIRGLLRTPGKVVRLIGLSGTGKTRLVQALFEDVGIDSPLDLATAFYTDVALSPSPTPSDLIQKLETSGQRGVVIVDNCPQQTHRQLAEACMICKFVNVITVEYDVRDDNAENTDVFRLEPASSEVIREVVRRERPELATVESTRIADVSDGNARLALAIARALKPGDSVVGKEDAYLFDRLFQQRNAADSDLLHVASVCALVYSFAVDGSDQQSTELGPLAKLADISELELFRHVTTLADRHLIQARGQWRALLPQVLASWLARRALASIPVDFIESTINLDGSERIFISFTRRLGDLHDCKEAVRLAEKWLAPQGTLGDVRMLSSSASQAFKNIAPISPERTLEALERAFSVDIVTSAGATNVFRLHYQGWASVLRSLAYETDLFARSVVLMARMRVSQKTYKDDQRDIKELFQIWLSGTLAPQSDRLQVIRGWLDRQTPECDSIANSAMQAMLSASCNASTSFVFGARSRAYGLWPANAAEIGAWFSKAIAFVAEVAAVPGRHAPAARQLLGSNFASLCSDKTHCLDALCEAFRSVSSAGDWPEGWLTVRRALGRRRAKLSDEGRRKLEKLESDLRPPDLLSRARAFMRIRHDDYVSYLDVGEEYSAKAYEAALASMQAELRGVGAEVAREDAVFESLVPELMSSNATGANDVAYGIATGSSDRERSWNRLVSAYAALGDAERTIDPLAGFIRGCSNADPQFESVLLEGAIAAPGLAAIFPALQSAGAPAAVAVDRLARSVELHLAPAHLYRDFWHWDIDAQSFSALVLKVANLDGGTRVAMELLGMRLTRPDSLDSASVLALRECGLKLLGEYDLERGVDDDIGYWATEVAERCMNRPGAEQDASALMVRLRDALSTHAISMFSYSGLLVKLFHMHPMAALDVFLGPDTHYAEVFANTNIPDDSLVLDGVASVEIEKWVAHAPLIRAPRAALITSAIKLDEAGVPVWSDRARMLLEMTPEPLEVYRAFEDQLLPLGYEVNAGPAERGRALLTPIAEGHADLEVRAWAAPIVSRFNSALAMWAARNRSSASRFE